MTDWTWGPKVGPDGTRFRLWAPGVDRLDVVVDGATHPMRAANDGWWEAETAARPGAAYLFRLPDGSHVPDPASRRQQNDVHGPSLVEASSYEWRHAAPETPWEAAVLCEVHIGTFTPEGTFRAAIEKLPLLADAGYTGVELLPVAQFGGRRGWGYDGVLLYCPHEVYGTPDDLRALVDAAHGAGLKIKLDVVYNHFGPDGNYIGAYAPDFFHEERHTPWGAGIAYDHPPVRRFIIENTLFWLDEYRFDGLRFDAIDHIHDPSDPDVLVEAAREIRDRFPDAWLATEDNRNVTYLHERDDDGRTRLMSGEWNDDWHNAAHVVATDETEGYYADFADDPVGHVARAAAEGFAYQGDPSPVSGEPRGKPSGHLPPQAFVDFLQNHDQIGNRALGERLTLLSSPARLHALQAVLLLSPHVPLMFMGEEWAAEEPFNFFADFDGELGRLVTEGRQKEFARFVGFAGAVPDPCDPATFERSRIDWAEREEHHGQAALSRTRTLLKVRAERVVPLLAGAGADCGRVLETPRDTIAVDWKLHGGILQLRANFTHHPETLLPVQGEVIHCEGPVMGAPNSAVFAVAPR